ncbi:methylated-DNA--[protein]-cysteine S-methyltransferase [Guyparkeria halophila]|nr:methylated-DNA--[protein]-cysteine S-methyltransferase [Guyparkeria halophila]
MNATESRWVPLAHSGRPGAPARGRLWVRLTITDGVLTGMRVEDDDNVEPHDTLPSAYADVVEALKGWGTSGGKPTDWTAHPGFPPSGTAFQRAVWAALCQVPWGESVGYGELARRVGRPGAARAVGQAVGANPWAPLVPCHRVLAAGQRLGGYAQGTRIKSRLLSLEDIDYR